MSRGGKTTKIDGIGNPLCYMLSGGNVNDNTVAVELLSYVNISESNILADKAYGTEEIRNYIDSQNSNYTISPNN